MLKIILTIILILYLGIISLWCYRFPFSYKLTNGTSHALIVDHDFTEQEREGVEEAYLIRQTVSNVLLFSSILVSLCSFVGLHKNWFRNKVILKATMYVSGFIAIVLLLVNGIHFIPEPPIR